MWFGKRKLRFKTAAVQVLALKKWKAPQTQYAAGFQIGRLVRHFGERRITEISETLWTEYVSSELCKRPRKFFDDRKYMRMILLYAVRQGYMAKMPYITIPDIPSEVGREITQDELKRLSRNASAALRFQIEIGWRMGLRLREMLRLRWDQFNWEKLTITFHARDTKTRRKREIPINPDLVGRFHSKRSRNYSQYVFPSPRDYDKPQDNNKTAWRRCKRRANVKARWHDLRHTCATRMLRAGIPSLAVRSYLGMGERVLNRIYAHLSIDDLRAAANVMSSRGPHAIRKKKC